MIQVQHLLFQWNAEPRVSQWWTHQRLIPQKGWNLKREGAASLVAPAEAAVELHVDAWNHHSGESSLDVWLPMLSPDDSMPMFWNSCIFKF